MQELTNKEIQEEIEKTLSAKWIKEEYDKAQKLKRKYIEIKLKEHLILQATHHQIYEELEQNPTKTIKIMEEIINLIHKKNLTDQYLKIIFTDPPKQESYITAIENIRSEQINKLIILKGTLKKASEITPYIEKVKNECKICGNKISYEIKDDNQNLPNKIRCPTCKSFMQQEIITNSQQMIEIETDIYSEEDSKIEKKKGILKNQLTQPEITRKIQIGKNYTMVGILDKKITKTESNYIIKIIGVESDDEDKKIIITPEEEEIIRQIPNKVEYFAKKLYTAILGYEEIKQALIIQMVGQQQIKNDNKITRGDIHQLLIGDMGSAKSTFLKLTTQYAIKSRFATGGGSSGTGLTGTVTRDEVTKSWVAEAGAMPLANKGILCIDEIDKMDEEEQKKLHEGMEQQEISLDKANIHIKLKCQTSILGAGNPKHGNITDKEPIYDQINFQPTFINRFDLVWIFKNQYDEEKTKAINRKAVENMTGTTEQIEEEPVEMAKKYFYLAKRTETKMSKIMQDKIVDWMDDVQKGRHQNQKPMTLNTRSVEALTRLTISHAKAELKNEAEEEDFDWAKKTYIESMSFIGLDPITQTIDINKMQTGTSNNERKIIDVMLDYIASNKEPVMFEDIRKQISNTVGDREIEMLLEKLSKLGEIYQPKNGQWKKA